MEDEILEELLEIEESSAKQDNGSNADSQEKEDYSFLEL